MDELEEDVAEVFRLLSLTQRSLPRRFLVQLLANLQQAAAHYQQQQQQEAQQQPQFRAGLRQEGVYHTTTANVLVHGLSASRDGYHQSQQYLPGNDAYLLGAATEPLSSNRPAAEALQLTSLAQTTKALDLAQLDAIWHQHDGSPVSYTNESLGGAHGDAAQLAAISNGFAGMGYPHMNQGIYRDATGTGLHGLHDVGGLSLGGHEPAGPSGQLPDLDGRLRSDAGLASGSFISDHGLRRDAGLQDAYTYDQRAGHRGVDSRKNGFGAGLKGSMGRMPGPGMPGSSLQHVMQQASPQFQPPPQASFALSLPVPSPPVFRTLSTCSWEQTESVVKVYVPLRGVHTELLRAVFEPNSVEVKVINLKGKNYVYGIASTFRPINPSACLAVASKTKKNILITIKKMNTSSMDEKHWEDLYRNPEVPARP